MRKLVIGVDVDDVTVDLCTPWVEWYNAKYDDNLPPWTDWDIAKLVVPACGSKVYDFLREYDYTTVKPIDGAVQGVRILRELGHRVIFITSCGYDAKTITASAGAKFAALQRLDLLQGKLHDNADYVVAAEKKLVKADLLIDDRASTIEEWGPQGILFSRPHNAEFHHSAGYRARSWEDIPSLAEKYARYISG